MSILLLSGLYFGNGVTLSKDEDFLLINETYRYRITKYFLKGKKQGKAEVFVDNLPGFPDNITRNLKGEFWVALFTVRNDSVDRMHPYSFLKKMVSKLPRFLWPKPAPHGYLLKLDEQGRFLQSLQDPGGTVLKEITSGIEKRGKLYIGSLNNERIGVFDLSSE